MSATGSFDVNGVRLEVETTGDGAPVVMLHGFPHTRHVWSAVAPALAASRRVVLPDLRGIGGSSRAADGYDASTLAADLLALLDALGIDTADVVAIDAGVPPAFLLAHRHPDRVRRLALMESTLGTLPGAEDFFAAGAPWWFGFHQVPDLAERVLAGHEAEYLDFFYRAGTADGCGIDPAIRDRFVAAYAGTESLRCGFSSYRAMPESGRQLAEAAADGPLRTPTLAIGARPVGDALARQLAPVADDLQSATIEQCGHIIPLDRPAALVELLQAFLGTSSALP